MSALALVRWVVAGCAVLKVWELVAIGRALQQPGILRSPRFDWLVVPGELTLLVLGAVVTLAAGALAMRRLERPPAAVVFVAFTYLMAADQQFYANHLYLLTLMAGILAVGPRVSQPLMLKSLVSIMYGFAAAAFLAVALWLPRFRRDAVILGFAMHGGMLVLLDAPFGIAIFAALSLSMYPLFFDRFARPGRGQAAEAGAGRPTTSTARSPAAGSTIRTDKAVP